jgi:hypothetical protein
VDNDNRILPVSRGKSSRRQVTGISGNTGSCGGVRHVTGTSKHGHDYMCMWMISLGRYAFPIVVHSFPWCRSQVPLFWPFGAPGCFLLFERVPFERVPLFPFLILTQHRWDDWLY